MLPVGFELLKSFTCFGKQKQTEKIQQNESNEDIIKNMEQYWDDFAKHFHNCDLNFTAVYCMFANLLNVQEADSILEVGCGTGQNIHQILQRKKSSTYYLASDLSTEMLSIAQARITNYLADPIFYFQKDIKPLIKPFDESIHFKEVNLEFKKLNAENLSMIKDGTFDCYFGNMCLMLVPNAQNMLNESFRVLKNKGRAILSVWGRKEYSLWQTALAEVGQSQGIEIKKMSKRCNFYLNNREQLIEMMKKAGYSKVMCWYNFVPFNLLNKEDFEKKFYAPEVKALFKAINDPKIEKLIKEKYKEKCYQAILEKQFPIGMDELTILGVKE